MVVVVEEVVVYVFVDLIIFIFVSFIVIEIVVCVEGITVTDQYNLLPLGVVVSIHCSISFLSVVSFYHPEVFDILI